MLNFRLFRAIIYEVFCRGFTLFCKCKKKNVFAGQQKQKFFFEDKDLKKKGFIYGKIYTYENRSRAKRAQFETVHGTIQTPVFMNVGTVGAIKVQYPPWI
mgnify:CR=1 FL=1